MTVDLCTQLSPDVALMRCQPADMQVTRLDRPDSVQRQQQQLVAACLEAAVVVPVGRHTGHSPMLLAAKAMGSCAKGWKLAA